MLGHNFAFATLSASLVVALRALIFCWAILSAGLLVVGGALTSGGAFADVFAAVGFSANVIATYMSSTCWSVSTVVGVLIVVPKRATAAVN